MHALERLLVRGCAGNFVRAKRTELALVPGTVTSCGYGSAVKHFGPQQYCGCTIVLRSEAAATM
jgi:hypothetical protein